MKRILLLALVVLTAGTFSAKSKPKPVRTALTARYAALADAWRQRDLNGVLNMRSPDFTAIQASGAVWDRAAVEAYTRAAFAQVETTLVLTFDLDTIDVRGDTADVAVAQHWVRHQQKGGRSRLVDTRAHQHEWWVHRGSQWLLFRIDRVQPGVWLVDGKRIDPSKPYDPDAPAFAPSLEK